MIATLPPYKPRTPVGMIQVIAVIAMILSLFLVKFHLTQRERQAIAVEFQHSRDFIFSMIDSATERQDLDTLSRIKDKYAGCVTDGTFRATLREALAKVAAREAELELTVSRHLDLLRHQEESALFPDPLKPQIPPETRAGDQPLSRLPR